MQNFSCFPGTTKLEQQLPLQGSCSNVRAFTWHTYPVILSPAQQTIKQYYAGNVFLEESSRPYSTGWQPWTYLQLCTPHMCQHTYPPRSNRSSPSLLPLCLTQWRITQNIQKQNIPTIDIGKGPAVWQGKDAQPQRLALWSFSAKEEMVRNVSQDNRFWWYTFKARFQVNVFTEMHKQLALCL